MFEETKRPMVVYHGTDVRLRRFNLQKSTFGTIWFTSDKKKILAGTAGASGRGYIVTAEVTINNPAGWNEYEKLVIDQFEGMGYDGAILPDPDGHFDCFVLSLKQIKILNVEKV
jgi:hypothetical protein